MEEIKKIQHLLRVVYLMMRKGILSKRKLMTNLQLFFKKRVAKARTNLIKSSTNLGTSSMDLDIMSYYNSHGVVFSCSNTPSYSPTLQKKRNHHREVFNYESASDSESVLSSPMWGFGMNFPKMVRVTDSPFPIKEEEEEEVLGDGSRVDRLADEFIRRFYEQLKLQQHTAMTPKYEFHR